MSYCGPRGIPHSFFLGGPHRWTEADREKALAWQTRKNETCPDCGTHPDQWNPDAGGHRQAFIADIDICNGCEQTERMQHAAATNDVWKSQRGKRISLHANPNL